MGRSIQNCEVFETWSNCPQVSRTGLSLDIVFVTRISPRCCRSVRILSCLMPIYTDSHHQPKLYDHNSDNNIPFTNDPKEYLYKPESTDEELCQMELKWAERGEREKLCRLALDLLLQQKNLCPWHEITNSQVTVSLRYSKMMYLCFKYMRSLDGCCFLE